MDGTVSNRERPDSPRHRERRAVLFALAAVVLWSTVATGFKLGLASMRPLQLLAFGSVVSLAFFAAAYLAVRPAPAPRRQLWRAAALGLVNPLAYYMVLFEAYDRLPAQIAQPLNYTWAITLAVLAVPILGQRLDRRTLAGIVVSYLGVVVLVTQGEFTAFDRFDGIGIALALGSTVLWAAYWLATVRLQMHPVQLLLAVFATGTPCVVAACHFTVGLPPLTFPNVGYGLWVGLVEMGVTFLLWQRALTLTSHAGRISQLIFLSPFLSLVLIARVLGEAIHPSAVVALALIVGGLLLRGR